MTVDSYVVRVVQANDPVRHYWAAGATLGVEHTLPRVADVQDRES